MFPVLMELLASPFKLNREYGHSGVPVLAAEQGFEPQFRDPESRVLPLHHSAPRISLFCLQNCNSPRASEGSYIVLNSMRDVK